MSVSGTTQCFNREEDYMVVPPVVLGRQDACWRHICVYVSRRPTTLIHAQYAARNACTLTITVSCTTESAAYCLHQPLTAHWCLPKPISITLHQHLTLTLTTKPQATITPSGLRRYLTIKLCCMFTPVSSLLVSMFCSGILLSYCYSLRPGQHLCLEETNHPPLKSSAYVTIGLVQRSDDRYCFIVRFDR